MDGWIDVDGMVEKGWMPLERSDLCPVRREYHANRSTSPCCQAVRRLPVGHFGPAAMGRNIGLVISPRTGWLSPIWAGSHRSLTMW